jgi:uncharacterized membrane protein (DUF2068 family)
MEKRAEPLQEHTAPPEKTGVKLIAGYKIGKAIVEAALGIMLVILVAVGAVARAHDLAMAIKEHLVHHWAIRLAEAIMRNLTVRRVFWVIAALIADAFISAFEGWALLRGYLWAPWLVVAATGLLLPVELTEIIRHVTFGRVALLVANLAIVIYLARGAWRAHRQHRAAHQSSLQG